MPVIAAPLLWTVDEEEEEFTAARLVLLEHPINPRIEPASRPIAFSSRITFAELHSKLARFGAVYFPGKRLIVLSIFTEHGFGLMARDQSQWKLVLKSIADMPEHPKWIRILGHFVALPYGFHFMGSLSRGQFDAIKKRWSQPEETRNDHGFGDIMTVVFHQSGHVSCGYEASEEFLKSNVDGPMLAEGVVHDMDARGVALLHRRIIGMGDVEDVWPDLRIISVVAAPKSNKLQKVDVVDKDAASDDS